MLLATRRSHSEMSCAPLTEVPAPSDHAAARASFSYWPTSAPSSWATISLKECDGDLLDQLAVFFRPVGGVRFHEPHQLPRSVHSIRAPAAWRWSSLIAAAGRGSFRTWGLQSS